MSSEEFNRNDDWPTLFNRFVTSDSLRQNLTPREQEVWLGSCEFWYAKGLEMYKEVLEETSKEGAPQIDMRRYFWLFMKVLIMDEALLGEEEEIDR